MTDRSDAMTDESEAAPNGQEAVPAIVLDGRLTRDARVPIDDRGLLLGDGVFETIGVRRGCPERLDVHLARLSRGLQAIGLPDVVPMIRQSDAVRRVIEANHLGGVDAAMRITVTAGSGPRGLPRPATVVPRWWISAAPYALGPDLAHGLCVVTDTAHRPAPGVSGVKHLSRLPWVLARQAARARGADEALILDADGKATCVSAGNVFAVRAGRLCTPGLDTTAGSSEGATGLAGVTRDAVIAVAADVGLAVEVAALTPREIAEASEAFVTNSLRIVTPIARLDDAAFAVPGPVTTRIAAALVPS